MTDYRVRLNKDYENIEFNFNGGPLHEDQELSHLYQSIGRFSLIWAQTEQHVDAILIHLNKQDHSESLYEKKIHTTFSGKISSLKKWFNQHPALFGLSDDFRIASSKLKELAPHRNTILHGSLLEWNSQTSTAVFRTMKQNSDDEIIIQRHLYTLDRIETACALTKSTNNYLSQISQYIFRKELLE